MPASRRKAPAPTAAPSQSSQQSTLSFNNKASRVTKANINTTEQVKKSKLSQLPAEKAVTAISTPEPEATIETSPETANVIILDSPTGAKSTASKRKRKQKSDGLEDARGKAAKVSDSQIRKYWKAEEDSRLAPRSTYLSLRPLGPLLT
jgi:DNA polymerase delta subunit 4